MKANFQRFWISLFLKKLIILINYQQRHIQLNSSGSKDIL